MDVTCSTSSIFNLVAISVDRYIAVTQLIKYAKHKSNAQVWVMIAVAWMVSTAIGSPVVLGLNNTPDRSPDQCLFNNSNYVIYSSFSFYILCIIMIFLYFRIFTAIHQRAKKQRVAKKTSSTLSSAVSSGAAAVAIENVVPMHRFIVPQDRPTNTASGSNDDDDDDNLDRSEMGIFEDLATTRSAKFMLAAVVEETGLKMANLAPPIPMMDPNTSNDSGFVPSNIEAEKEHIPPLFPKEDKKKENTLPKKPELK